PKDAGGIQTVASPEIIRQRHPANYLLDPSARIDCRPQRVAAEYVDRLQVARRTRRPHRIAELIDGWRESGRTLVLSAGKKSKDALPRLGSQHGPGHILFQ